MFRRWKYFCKSINLNFGKRKPCTIRWKICWMFPNILSAHTHDFFSCLISTSSSYARRMSLNFKELAPLRLSNIIFRFQLIYHFVVCSTFFPSSSSIFKRLPFIPLCHSKLFSKTFRRKREIPVCLHLSDCKRNEKEMKEIPLNYKWHREAFWYFFNCHNFRIHFTDN